MTDVNHWDFAESFTAVQAALLIEGKPASVKSLDGVPHFANDQGRGVSDVILERMERDYLSSWNAYAILEQMSPSFTECPFPSNGMKYRASEFLAGEDGGRFEVWLKSDDSGFYKQTFSREVIQQWLQANQLPSSYQFTKSPINSIPATADQSSQELSTKERNSLLRILATVCKEAQYDWRQPSKFAQIIADSSKQIGATVSKRTVENYLKAISNVLD